MTELHEHGSRLGYSALAAAILILALYIYGQSNIAFLYPFANILPPLTALLAFSTAYFTLRMTWTNLVDRSSKIWLSYALAMFLLFLAETSWAAYSLLFDVRFAFPSVVNVLSLAGQFALLSALLLQVWPLREVFSAKRFAVALVSTVIVLVVLSAVLFPLSIVGKLGIAVVFAGSAYYLLDVLLLVVAIPSFVFFMKGSLWRPMLFVVTGIILTAATNIILSVIVLEGAYYNGHPAESLFNWSYLTFALGFHLQLRQAQEPRRHP